MFRLMERLGSVASPFIAAALVVYVGYEGAIVRIGGFLAVSAVLFHACFRETAGPALVADRDDPPCSAAHSWPSPAPPPAWRSRTARRGRQAGRGGEGRKSVVLGKGVAGRCSSGRGVIILKKKKVQS